MPEISVHDLIPHPRNQAIYGTDDIHDLVNRIAESGWIKPLVVNSSNQHIISGNRRWRAACELGLAKVPVEYREFASENDELEALLLENEGRSKTPEQKVREAEIWQEIESAKAQARMMSGINQHSPTPNLAEASKGETRAKVAEKIGMKHATFDKAVKVVEKSDALKTEGKTKEAQELLNLLNEKSVDAAYKQVKTQVKEAVRLLVREERQAAADAADDAVSPPTLIREYKYGDVVRIGRHILVCTDNRSELFMSLLDEIGTSALTFCDPPYNAEVADWDDGHFEWDQDFLQTYSRVVAVTPGISSIQEFMRRTSMRYRWSLSAHIANGYSRSPVGFGNWIYTAIFSEEESIHHNAQDITTITLSGKHVQDLLSMNDDLAEKRQKPPNYLAWLFQLFTKEQEWIVDPFGGSGNSVIVADKLGRNCLCAEIDPDTFSRLVARMVNYHA